MKKFKIYILVFFMALCIPLSYVVWRTLAGMAQEELAQLRFFAETLFDQMEKELSGLVQREENRAVDEYNNQLIASDNSIQPSPLAGLPQEPFILGYLQNNPDGTLHTPLADDPAHGPVVHRPVLDRLQEANRIFNQKKYSLPTTAEPTPPAPITPEPGARSPKGFAERYLAPPEKSAKTVLGQKSVRVEEISPRQAANLTQEEASGMTARSKSETAVRADQNENKATDHAAPGIDAGSETRLTEAERDIRSSPNVRFQVEVAPLQSVFIDDDQVFVFRRVAIGNQIFRQGFILRVRPFLHHLRQSHFDPHPMAGFTYLSLKILGREGRREGIGAGATAPTRAVVAGRTFPAPFHFLSADLMAEKAPASAARRSLMMALGALGTVVLLGLAAIYHSVRSVVDMSERRSRFVSSVTHELKTPLTNIRMYVEMLEQGIAATPDREQAYLGIIGSESTRLSRLIDNVLELSRLEKKQRVVHMQPGKLEDLLAEVHSIMSPKLDQEGFELVLPPATLPEFSYDREAMLQVMINLIENSIKFGRNEPLRRIVIAAQECAGWLHIAIQDSGPGIPRPALKRVFDDFYRADNALTRATGGTGIGLALVRKLVQAMGGRVQAANNDSAGCTVTVSLPLTAR